MSGIRLRHARGGAARPLSIFTRRGAARLRPHPQSTTMNSWKPLRSEGAASGASKRSMSKWKACVSVESGYMGGRVERPGLSLRLHRQHRPHRGGAGDLRPGGDFHPGDPRSLLRDPRPHLARPAGQRRRHPVPLGDLLSHAGTVRNRAGADRRAGARKDLEPPHRHRSASRRSKFYPAEDYHQNYFANNPQQPYCSFVVSPKVRKFREKFAAKMRKRA